MNTVEQKLKSFERLLTIMDELRAQCPWDKKQTLESLRYLTIEETYELADAILEKDMDTKINNLVSTSILSAKNKLTMFENDKENYNPQLLEELQKAELNSISSNIGKSILDLISALVSLKLVN